MLFQLMFKDPVTFILIAFPLLYSIILHEMAHAVVAYKFGDNTAKYSGRFSLNPLLHLDPIGTLMLLFMGFGWAKPVPINYYNLRPRKLGIILCSIAGVTTNFLIALICLVTYNLLMNFFPSQKLMLAMMTTAQINLILASFNLIPIPPLDGSRVLAEISPPELKNFLIRLEPYGIVIIFALLYLGILDPVINLIMNVLLYLISILI